MANFQDYPGRRTLPEGVTPHEAMVLDERSIAQGATVSQAGPTSDACADVTARLDDLQRRLQNLSLQRSAQPSVVSLQYIVIKLRRALLGDITRFANIGDRSGNRARANVFFRILKHLNLQQFERPFRRALSDRHVHFTTQQAIKQELDVHMESVIKKINAKKLLGDDVRKLVEEAFLALIRDDETKKSTLDFISAYNDESVSLPTSFYNGLRRAKQLATKFWINHLLEMVATAADRHRDDNDEMKRILARVCGVLSKKLLEQNRKNLRGGSFEERTVEVHAMALHYIIRKRFLHAVLAFCTSAELFKLENDGDESINDMSACVARTFNVIEFMKGRSAIVVDHVIPLVKGMRSHFSLIENATKVVRIRGIASCSYSIARSYFALCCHQQCSSELESAIDHMERELGEEASKLQVYACCLCLSAHSYRVMGDNAKATEFVKLALEAYENADDWKDYDEKIKVLDSITKNLRMLKSLQGK